MKTIWKYIKAIIFFLSSITGIYLLWKFLAGSEKAQSIKFKLESLQIKNWKKSKTDKPENRPRIEKPLTDKEIQTGVIDKIMRARKKREREQS